MKNLELRITFCLLPFALCLFSGCRQPNPQDAAAGSSDMIRRAQMVGQENIQLKKQIETLEQRIADLEKQVEAEQTENARIMAQHSDIYTGLMRNLLDCSTKLEQYEQEN